MAAPERRAAQVPAAALLALAALAGCAALAPHYEHPQLSVVGVELKDASLAEQHFRVRMRVQNPNDRALPVRGIDYTLRIGGEDFGTGSSVSAFTVPARGEAEFELVMTTNLASTLWKVLPRLKDSAQPLEYQLSGKVSTDLAFLHTIPFDERGSFAVR
ncbi:MAG TPA: LEA type 2 family protein [Steroidobacteraceae bacterium]|nr:LEA type 2 family protein [Steroidobacteraceae bacterium]